VSRFRTNRDRNRWKGGRAVAILQKSGQNPVMRRPKCRDSGRIGTEIAGKVAQGARFCRNQDRNRWKGGAGGAILQKSGQE
jgi:hypothetical protein